MIEPPLEHFHDDAAFVQIDVCAVVSSGHADIEQHVAAFFGQPLDLLFNIVHDNHDVLYAFALGLKELPVRRDALGLQSTSVVRQMPCYRRYERVWKKALNLKNSTNFCF